MLGKIVVIISALAFAGAQIPSLGWCPEYVPMANFDMAKFLGVWYEAERYFQLSEVVSRCVMTNYTKGNDGKFHVSNEVTNRFTGVKRVLEGEIKPASSKAEEGKLHVKYTTLPLTPETKYSVLETDYKNYAVLWNCAGLGPVHTQNAWIMTRQRLAPGEILQKAYGVLDKYKISKTFFVKTDQDDCAYLASQPSAPPVEEPQSDEPIVEQADEELTRNVEDRPQISPDAPEIVLSTRKAEIDAKEKPAVEAPAAPVVLAAPVDSVAPVVPVVPVVLAAPVDSVAPVVPVVPVVPVAPVVPASPVVPEAVSEVKVQEVKPAEPASVPELLVKVANQAKEVVEEAIEKIKEVPKKVFKQQEVISEAEKTVA